MKSELEEHLLANIRQLSLSEPLRQYKFVAQLLGEGKGVRKRIAESGLKNWQFDFCWPEYRLAVEVEGGTWINGGHNRGAYYEDNCRKYNAALEMGWRVLRYTGDMVKSGEAVNQIERVICARKV